MRKLRIVATWLLSALVLSACGASSVSADMQRIITSILFGAPVAAKPKPAQPSAPLVPSIPFAPPIDYGFPALKPLNDPCPTAPPGTPADSAATPGVSGLAKDGARRFQGVYRSTDSTGVTTYRSAFEQRYFVAAKNDGTVADPFTSAPVNKYEFTEIQPDYQQAGVHDQITYTIQTNSAINQNAATYNGNQDPSAGIAITDFQRLNDKDNSKIEEFKPTNNGLLLFPQPFDASSFGQYYWDFTASDPVDGWTEQIFGLATNQRHLVNACGAVVEGWPVQAYVIIHKKDSSGVPQAPIEDSLNLVVAPQYGGLTVQRSLCEGPANPSDVATLQAWNYGAEGFLGLPAGTVPGYTAPAAPTFSGPTACLYQTQENIAGVDLLPLPAGVG